MPKVNLDLPCLDLAGIEIKDSADATKNIMMKTVVLNALMGTYPNEHPTGEEKATRWNLALRVAATEGEQEFKADEIVLIKKLVGFGYGPLVVGQVYKHLDV